MNTKSIQIIREKREMTDHEKEVMVLNQMCGHLFIRTLDDLKETTVYRQKTKLLVNQLIADLEKHSSQVSWDPSVDQSDVDVAFEQMQHGADMVKYLMLMMKKLSRIPEPMWLLFWIEMNQVFKRFGIGIKVDQDGNFRCFDTGDVSSQAA